MNRSRFVAAIALAVAGAVSAGAAPPITLHVNTGLWEITSEITMHGMPNIPAAMLDKLPPERRARALAAMQAAMASAAKPQARKSCVTQKELDRPFRGMQDEPGMTCKETVISATSTVEDIKVACTGKRTMNGTFHFEAPTPATMHGHVTMAFSEAGRSMNTAVEMQGQWLGSACGSVKPSQGG